MESRLLISAGKTVASWSSTVPLDLSEEEVRGPAQPPPALRRHALHCSALAADRVPRATSEMAVATLFHVYVTACRSSIVFIHGLILPI